MSAATTPVHGIAASAGFAAGSAAGVTLGSGDTAEGPSIDDSGAEDAGLGVGTGVDEDAGDGDIDGDTDAAGRTVGDGDAAGFGDAAGIAIGWTETQRPSQAIFTDA